MQCGIIYSLITTAEELLDYLSHTQAPDAALRAIHASRPITRPNGMRTICNSPQCGQAQHCSMCRAQWKQWCCISRATPNGEPSHWPSMAGRVATATAIGSRDCHHTETTAAPAQTHRNCSAPPLSNAGVERRNNAGGERARARRK